MKMNERWYTKNIKEVEETLNTDITYGLAEEDINIRKEKFGKNILKEQKKEKVIIKY